MSRAPVDSREDRSKIGRAACVWQGVGDGAATEMSELDVGRATNAWVMTLFGLGLGPETAGVTIVVWALLGCASGASVFVARRSKADWKERQLRDDEPLISREPRLAKAPKAFAPGLWPPVLRFPMWMIPYAQLLALGPFNERVQWTAHVDGAGWVPAAAKLSRVLLLAEPTGTWGPVERGQGWRGSSPITSWLEAGDETTDERVFWLTVLGYPLLLRWALRQALRSNHMSFSANVCVEVIGACSLPAWRVLFMPIGGVCPSSQGPAPAMDVNANDTAVVGRPVFNAAESISAPRCWQRNGPHTLSMALVGAILLLPCWVFGMQFASHAETLWHGAGRSVYVSTAAVEKQMDEESGANASEVQSKEAAMEEEDKLRDNSAHPLDRFPCRVEYAIYRVHRLLLATVIAVGLQGAGVGPAILVVFLTLILELWCLLWRKPYQHKTLNYVRAFIVVQSLIIAATALADVTTSGNIEPAGVSPDLLQHHKRAVAVNFVSVSSLLLWSAAAVVLGDYLVRDYRRRWRMYRRVQTVVNSKRALSAIKALSVSRVELPVYHSAKRGAKHPCSDKQPRPPSRGLINPRRSRTSSDRRDPGDKRPLVQTETGPSRRGIDDGTLVPGRRTRTRSRDGSHAPPDFGIPTPRIALSASVGVS